MKVFTLLATSQAFVVEMFRDADCGGDATRRNVYDNTCAYTDGFKSFKFLNHGGPFQQLTAYSRQACAGKTVYQNCASGVNSIEIDACITTDGSGNALSSYSSGGPCPK